MRMSFIVTAYHGKLRSLRTANEACLRIRYRRRRRGGEGEREGGLDERNNRDMLLLSIRKIRIGISYKRYRSISIRRFIHSFKDNAFIITMKFLILAHGKERDAKALPKFSSSFDLYPRFFAISRERSFRRMHLTGRLCR